MCAKRTWDSEPAPDEEPRAIDVSETPSSEESPTEASADRVWLRCARLVLGRLQQGNEKAALRKAHRAIEHAAAFPPGDPRMAAALNNAAVAHTCSREPRIALELHERAASAWRETQQTWVDTMRLEQRARSSLFHMRMELKHRRQYDATAREERRREVVIGAVLARLNTAATLACDGREEAARRECAEALERGRTEFGDAHELVRFALHRHARLRRDANAGAPGSALSAWGITTGATPAPVPAGSDDARLRWAFYWTLVIGGRDADGSEARE